MRKLRIGSPLRLFGRIFAVAWLFGCQDAGTVPAPAEAVSETVTREISFLERFSPVGRVALEQNEIDLVARVADMALGPDGKIYIVDNSEGNVKVYAPNGRLLRVVGKKGEGPGEFLQPWRVEIDDLGMIHVADQSLNEVVVFDSTGEFIHSIPLQGFIGVHDFELMPNGEGYAVVSAYVTSEARQFAEEVLLVLDTLGRVAGRHLPIRGLVPEGETDGPVWDYPRAFSLEQDKGNLLVTSAMRSDLWSVNVDRQDIRGSSVEFADYLPPQLPPETHPAWASGRRMIEWFHTRHLNGYLLSYNGGLLWPFMKGEYMSGAKVVLLHRYDALGEWELLRDPPLVLAANRELIAAVANPARDDMQIVFYTLAD